MSEPDPIGLQVLGILNHDDDLEDQLGDDGAIHTENHVFYHHVREHFYHIEILNMQSISFYAPGIEIDPDTEEPVDPTPPNPAPILTNPLVEPDGPFGGSFSIITNEAGGTLFWYVSTVEQAPIMRRMRAGNGSASAAFGSQPVTAAGVQVMSVVGELEPETTYYVYFMHRDSGSKSSLIVGGNPLTTTVEPDTIPPTLSYISEPLATPSSIALQVGTNEANGELFWFVSASPLQPSVDDLKTGTAGLEAGSQPVTELGLQDIIILMGLIEGVTYYVHLLHTDAAGNNSARLSSIAFDITEEVASTIFNTPSNSPLLGGAVIGFVDPANALDLRLVALGV